MSPKAKMWTGLIVAFVAMGVAVFVPAGTFDYWQAWTFLAVGALSSVLLTLFIIRDPVLLEGRTKGGPTAEQRPIQKIIVLLLSVPAIATFVVPGLDRRFGWSSMPPWVSILGDVLILVSMWMVFRVFKANSFGAATVRISKGQTVISTGPYAIVRNPMYSSAVVYFVAVSLALGSYWALLAAFLVILGFVVRLFDEERFLAKELSGYAEYCTRVRWHLIPGVF